MVSKARLDFPLPLGPVTTVSFPSGRSTSIPLRLFCRAPRISMQSCVSDTLARVIFATFEPTGNNSRLRGDSQILWLLRSAKRFPRRTDARASPSGRRLQRKPRGELLALVLQLFRHHAA